MWTLWKRGKPLVRIPVRPLLASWNKKTDPAMVRLQAYLDEVERALAPYLQQSGMSLRLVADVGSPSRLLSQYDVENYLTPLATRLGQSRFSLVEGEKVVGGGSFLELGVADPGEALAGGVTCRPRGSCQHVGWKSQIREALRTAGVSALPPGPVEVHLAFRVPAGRNWVSLWKPAGDAMGPILGEPRTNPFHPSDDRITKLHLHRFVGSEVEVGMWWQPAGHDRPRSHVVAEPVPETPPPPRRSGVVDEAVESARRVGADRKPVRLAVLRRDYLERNPGCNPDSLDASLNLHCINMPTRLSPGSVGGWKTRPLFKRRSRGLYMLLSEEEIARFHDLLAAGDERLLQPEYDADEVLRSPTS